MPLEPLPETRQALERVGRWSQSDLLVDLLDRGDQVRRVVPSCVGLSLTVSEGSLTFTLVSSSEDVSLLDGVQYAVGGPCVDAVEDDTVIHGGGDDEGLLDEGRWAVFARASAAHGVRSTLSMPLHEDGTLVGGVNLYASETEAFEGKADEVAALLGAWAPAAVSNADLGFTTREAARRAPGLIEDSATVDQATGVVMAARRVDRDTAREVIADAARRAGSEDVAIARAILLPHTPREDG